MIRMVLRALCFRFAPALYFKVEEFGREIYKLAKQFTTIAKKGEEKDRSDKIRRRKKDEEEEKLEDKFAPLKVANTVKDQIRDFKVG